MELETPALDGDSICEPSWVVDDLQSLRASLKASPSEPARLALSAFRLRS